jgi:hypothetical protein
MRYWRRAWQPASQEAWPSISMLLTGFPAVKA